MSNDNYYRPATAQWYKEVNAEYEERTEGLDLYLRRSQTTMINNYQWRVGYRRSLRTQWKGTNYGILFASGDINWIYKNSHKWERRVHKRSIIQQQLDEALLDRM